MGTTRSKLSGLARGTGALAVLLLLSQSAVDAAGFVKVIGARTRNNVSNSSITVTIPSSDVAAGNSILVTVQAGSSAGVISCSDPTNGAYSTDVSSAPDGNRIAIASKHNVAALGFGTLITCTYPTFSGVSSVAAYEFIGLEPVNTLDQTAQDGSSLAGVASSRLTAVTGQANELVFGLFWLSNPPPTETFTPATSGGSPVESPYAPPYSQPTGVGTQYALYRIVSSIRQYEANGTIGGTGTWKAQVATYRLAPDLCAGVGCDDGNSCTADSCDPGTGLCAHAPEPAGTSCGSPSSGICDAPDECDDSGVCQTNHVADGTVCGEVDSDCEKPDTCLAGACHDNGVKPAGVACGDSSSNPCDAPDACNGSGFCQANHATDGTACGDSGTECVNQDSCVAGTCHDNGFPAAGTPCGDRSSGVCDASNACDGSGHCDPNNLASGTPCNDGEACTIGDACAAGECVGTRDEVCFACVGNSLPVVVPVANAEPTEPTPVGSANIIVAAVFTDTPGQGHTCTIDWGDGSGPDAGGVIEPTLTDPGSCIGAHLYTAVGVYVVSITITDPCDESATAVHQYAVIYDPEGGFVTGGGWFDSPPGACAPNPVLSGRANFGFVAKHLKGHLAGETHLRFIMAGFRFDADSCEWLAISGAKARCRGTGSVNGNGSFAFELTAWDGQGPGGGGVDKLRIRIWDSDQGNAVVYDNQMNAPESAEPTTALGGGSLVIQKK